MSFFLIFSGVLNNACTSSKRALRKLCSGALSAADACRDADALIEDGSSCPLASMMAKWHHGGHPERSFSRMG